MRFIDLSDFFYYTANSYPLVLGKSHKIIVLKDGMVAEQGKPEDLMNTGGEFAKMVNLQSESAKWAVAGTVTNKR